MCPASTSWAASLTICTRLILARLRREHAQNTQRELASRVSDAHRLQGAIRAVGSRPRARHRRRPRNRPRLTPHLRHCDEPRRQQISTKKANAFSALDTSRELRHQFQTWRKEHRSHFAGHIAFRDRADDESSSASQAQSHIGREECLPLTTAAPKRPPRRGPGGEPRQRCTRHRSVHRSLFQQGISVQEGFTIMDREEIFPVRTRVTHQRAGSLAGAAILNISLRTRTAT